MENIFLDNKNLLEKEYKEKKVQLESFPTNLEVLVSTKCNLDCFMCSFGIYKNKFSMNTDLEIFKRLKTLYPYLENLKLNGAEIFNIPFNEHELIDSMLIDSMQYKNMKLAGISNGFLIGKERAEIIAEKFDRLELPVDSPNDEVYRSIRIGSDLEKFSNNISLINKIKKDKGLSASDSPCLNFSAIVMDRTYKDIPKLVDLIHSLGGNSLGLRPLTCDLKEADWEKIKKEDIFTDKEKTKEWKNILKEVKKTAESKGVEIIDTTIFAIDENFPELLEDSDFYDEEETEDADKMELCSSPWDSLYIGSKGYASFALCSNFILGDLNHSKIAEIWNGKGAKEVRKMFIKGDYSSCSSNCIKNYSFAGKAVHEEDLITRLKRKFSL